MNVREYVETAGFAIAIVTAWWGLRKAGKESAGLSDDNARKLREDVGAQDLIIRSLRTHLHQAEMWIIGHMMRDHGDTFDPASMYQVDEETAD